MPLPQPPQGVLLSRMMAADSWPGPSARSSAFTVETSKAGSGRQYRDCRLSARGRVIRGQDKRTGGAASDSASALSITVEANVPYIS